MASNLHTPQMMKGISKKSAKVPTLSELMAPSQIKKDGQGARLSTDMIFDARADPFYTPSIMRMQPAYLFAETGEPCIGTTDLGGVTAMRVKPRDGAPQTFGIYPQPKLGSRSGVFGLSVNKCEVKNSKNKILRSGNNFRHFMKPPFPEFKQ